MAQPIVLCVTYDLTITGGGHRLRRAGCDRDLNDKGGALVHLAVDVCCWYLSLFPLRNC